jgi:transposase
MRRVAPATSKRCERCWSRSVPPVRFASAAPASSAQLVITAPDDPRVRLSGLTSKALVAEALVLRVRPGSDPVRHATKTAIVTLARRVQAINAEIAVLDCHIDTLVRATAPGLVAVYGVGADTAAILLVAAGDNATRIHPEAAGAQLCGVAPIPAGSGKTNRRHRLNPGGNRQANHALWRIVFTRMGSDPRTRIYVERRLAEGRSKPEIMRVLKRYVAREVYRHLPR